jgi:hypothetical protein
MRFMLLMITTDCAKAGPGPLAGAESVGAMSKYNESLQRAGILLALDGLHPPSRGARLSFHDKRATVTGWPFEAEEVLGGYWLIQVKSKEEALEWAKRCPARDGDVIEVRQVREAADLPAEAC